jgi:hypothetical protein
MCCRPAGPRPPSRRHRESRVRTAAAARSDPGASPRAVAEAARASRRGCACSDGTRRFLRAPGVRRGPGWEWERQGFRRPAFGEYPRSLASVAQGDHHVGKTRVEGHDPLRFEGNLCITKLRLDDQPVGSGDFGRGQDGSKCARPGDPLGAAPLDGTVGALVGSAGGTAGATVVSAAEGAPPHAASSITSTNIIDRQRIMPVILSGVGRGSAAPP